MSSRAVILGHSLHTRAELLVCKQVKTIIKEAARSIPSQLKTNERKNTTRFGRITPTHPTPDLATHVTLRVVGALLALTLALAVLALIPVVNAASTAAGGATPAKQQAQGKGRRVCFAFIFYFLFNIFNGHDNHG